MAKEGGAHGKGSALIVARGNEPLFGVCSLLVGGCMGDSGIPTAPSVSEKQATRSFAVSGHDAGAWKKAIAQLEKLRASEPGADWVIQRVEGELVGMSMPASSRRGG